jgi:autotransporter-associated beta strand protein
MALEHLEERLAPATFIWDGGGTTNKWSDAGNWQGNVAPNASGGHDLVFPANPTKPMTDNDLANAVVNSIAFSGSGYMLTGNGLTLGISNAAANVNNNGYIIASNPTNTNNTLAFSGAITLAVSGGSGNRQFFSVGNNAATLTINNPLSGQSGVELAKSGPGTLILTADNSSFSGPISIVEGPLKISNAKALGDDFSPTTVLASAQSGKFGQLQIEGTGLSIAEPLFLNGPGLVDNGALLNISGNNVWAGPIELDSDSTIGANATTTLTIEGVISDLNLPQDLTKEGAGRLILDPLDTPDGNTYRGQTFINNGIVAIRHSLALGNQPPTFNPITNKPTNNTIVNSSTNRSGTLELDFTPNPRRVDFNATPTGFTVPFEMLTLNGPGTPTLDPSDSLGRTLGGIHQPAKLPGIPGATATGALHNLTGDNTWTQNITFFSDAASAGLFDGGAWDRPTVGIGAELNTNLTLDGVINDINLVGAPDYSFVKTRAGRVILTNNNTYRGRTEVLAGFLNIRDSHALGAAGTTATGTTVFPNGTLELEVDAKPDSSPAGLSPDGKMHMDTDIVISLEQISLLGTGAGGVAGATGARGSGALRNISGTNEITGNLPLLTTIGKPNGNNFLDRGAWIGVEPDPDPLNADGNAFNDFSQLTISGTIQDGAGRADLFKTGAGELVLTADAPGSTGNTYTGITYIMQGWITARDNHALGADILGLPFTRQPETHVVEGAALHLKQTRIAGLPITLLENLWLAGDGMDNSQYAEMNHKGALENLSGVNSVPYDVRFINKPNFPQTGIGTDLDPRDTSITQSEMTFTGQLSETPPPFSVSRGVGQGGNFENHFLIDAGSVAGTVQISYVFGTPFNPLQDRLIVYYEGTVLFDTGTVTTNGAVITSPILNFPPAGYAGPNNDTFLDVVMNQGASGFAWSWTANVTP